MQLTRAVLTLALAATTTSSLPTGSLNAQGANEGSVSGISDAGQEQSIRHPEYPQEGFASAHGRKEAMMSLQDSMAARIQSRGYQKDIPFIPNGNGQQSGQINQVKNTSEFNLDNKDSASPGPSRKMPSIHPSKEAPFAQLSATAAAADTEHTTEQRNNHAAATNSNNNKSGFTLKVRDLIESVAQGREQMHPAQQAQGLQEHCAEQSESVNIRNDAAQAQLSPNEMNANMGNNMEQSLSTRQDRGTENTNLATGVNNGKAAAENDEISGISTSSNLKVARSESHVDLSTSTAASGLSGQQQAESQVLNNQQQQEQNESRNQQREEKNNSLNQHQTQAHMGMMDCLRAAMGDIRKQSLCLSSMFKDMGSAVPHVEGSDLD